MTAMYLPQAVIIDLPDEFSTFEIKRHGQLGKSISF